MTALVLASASAARAAILTGAGVAFARLASGLDEDAVKTEMLRRGAGPAEVARELARRKALAVARRADALVIGADQTLDLDGELLDKAASRAEARAQLQRLRGRTHRLHSAVALARGGAILWEESQAPALTMRAFSDAFLGAYVDRLGDGILGSVGCYQLEGEGAQLFSRVEGDYFAILGLPLFGLLGQLRQAGLLAA